MTLKRKSGYRIAVLKIMQFLGADDPVKTSPQTDVVCRCSRGPPEAGVVVNTNGEEMKTSCPRTASFASCAWRSALQPEPGSDTMK